jgi:hypothetical protein
VRGGATRLLDGCDVQCTSNVECSAAEITS